MYFQFSSFSSTHCVTLFVLSCFLLCLHGLPLASRCLCLLLMLLIVNSVRRLLISTGWLSSFAAGRKASRGSRVRRALLCSLPRDRPAAPTSSTPPQREEISHSEEEQESVSLVLLVPFLPLLREPSEKTVKLGSVGETSLNRFVSCDFFCFKFRKVRNCLLIQNSYKKMFHLPLDWGRRGERGRWGVGEAGSWPNNEPPFETPFRGHPFP